VSLFKEACHLINLIHNAQISTPIYLIDDPGIKASRLKPDKGAIECTISVIDEWITKERQYYTITYQPVRSNYYNTITVCNGFFTTGKILPTFYGGLNEPGRMEYDELLPDGEAAELSAAKPGQSKHLIQSQRVIQHY